MVSVHELETEACRLKRSRYCRFPKTWS